MTPTLSPNRVISFTVPAVPVAQPRQRHRVVFTGNGRPFASNYTPEKSPVNAFKATVRLAAAAAFQGSPLEGPLELVATFVMPRPERLIWKKRPMPREHYHAKGRNDWDNLGKSLCDALSGLVWHDDGQLAEVHVRRQIAAGDEQPHVEVEICVLENPR